MRAPYSRTFFDLLCEQAERYPGAVAVIGDEVPATYAELRNSATRIATGLHALGVGKGDRVGLILDNRTAWLEICFGVAAIGAVLVPLSTWSKRRELDFLIGDSRIKVLFTLDRLGQQEYAKDLAGLVPAAAATGSWSSDRYPMLQAVLMLGSEILPGALDYDCFGKNLAPLALPLPPGCGAHAQDPALILYTSGSTSYPKAVPLVHGACIENGFNIGERQGLTPGDRVHLSPPLFWSYGSANGMIAALTHGATLVLQGRFEPAQALDLIERHRCTAIYTLPGMTNAMILHESFKPERTRTLRTGVTIGSPRDIEVAALTLGAREICNIYGQTESYGNCTVTWHHWPLARRMQVQGPPLPGVTIRILDEASGSPVAAGDVGLIEVKGYITPGYDGVSAQNNATAFTNDGYFRTGDLGLLTPEGDVQFAARTTEMIKRSGINIAPSEVEEVLRHCPGVAEAGVAGVPDAHKGEIVLAFVVAKPGAQLTEEMLRQFCRREAAVYKTPDQVQLCSALPTTPTGKLMRSELKKMALNLRTHTQ
ncbi:MAG: class I adenylate-forming enzyme family protein [Burkholderiales bacterium]